MGTAQAASAQLQLNQALGSGRLQGEEFNAINEATPQLLDAVAKVMGVTRGELRKLASEGKISSKILIQALTDIKEKGAGALEEGLSGAFKAQREFDKALKEFSAAVGTELLPAIVPLLQQLSNLLKAFGDLPGPAKTAAVAIGAIGIAAIAVAPAFGGFSYWDKSDSGRWRYFSNWRADRKACRTGWWHQNDSYGLYCSRSSNHEDHSCSQRFKRCLGCA